ncbi:MAG: DUF3857 domain-containing protein [Deltaproteobacteria bacterium]|nr:DUF3857 domain-containing protein [Deltaproteobacteria bacterium]
MLLVFCFVTTGVSCQTAPPQQEKFHNDERLTAAAYPDVPAVILLDRHELNFTFAPNKQRPYAELVHTRRIQLLNNDAQIYKKMLIPFDDRSQIFHIQGRILRADGSIVNMPNNRSVNVNLFAKSRKAAAMYNDVGAKLTKVSGAKKGDVIEVSYVRVYKDARWVDPIAIGGPLPIERGEVVVSYPNAFDVDYRVLKQGRVEKKERPAVIPTKVKSVEGKGEGVSGKKLAFVFKKVRALYPEDRRPDDVALSTQVHLQLKGYTFRGKRYSAYETWNDVARWYSQLTQNRDTADTETKKAVRALGGKGGTKRQKVQRVQRFLQDEVVDVPSFLNIAALAPHNAGEVAARKIGDAKDQTSLGLAMLRHMGLDGFPVLVSRLGSHAQVPDLPSPAAFNHVLIAIPSGGRYTFIDPATPFLPTGRLPGPVQGQRGILVRGNEAIFIDLPIDPPSANRRLLEYRLALSLSGTVTGQLKIQLDGLDAALVRGILQKGGEPEEVARRIKALLLPQETSGLRWAEVLPMNKTTMKAGATLVLQVMLQNSALADEKQGALTVNLSGLLGRPLPSVWREGRQSPMLFPFRYREKVRMALSLPDGWGIEAIPVAQSVENSLVNGKEFWTLSDGTLFLERELQLSGRWVEKSNYRKLSAPVKTLWRNAEAGVRIVKGGDRGQSYGVDPF